jgi:hypothetical protein
VDVGVGIGIGVDLGSPNPITHYPQHDTTHQEKTRQQTREDETTIDRTR